MVETRGQRALSRYFRDKRGKSQCELAGILKCAQPSISAWVHGHARPGPHHRRALERLTGIREDEWMTDDERSVAAGSERPRRRTGTAE